MVYGRSLGGLITVVHRHHEAIGEQRLVEVIVPPLWGSCGGFQRPIEAVRDIVERPSSEESRVLRMQAAADYHDDLEHPSFKIVKPLEDFFSKQPAEDDDRG
jgi:hypothetical protein